MMQQLSRRYKRLRRLRQQRHWKSHIQNNQTFVDKTEDGAVLITGSPQARRLYYHPEYNFQRGKNANAGAAWLEPYISGDKKDFVKTEFAKALKRRIGTK